MKKTLLYIIASYFFAASAFAEVVDVTPSSKADVDLDAKTVVLKNGPIPEKGEYTVIVNGTKVILVSDGNSLTIKE